MWQAPSLKETNDPRDLFCYFGKSSSLKPAPVQHMRTISRPLSEHQPRIVWPTICTFWKEQWEPKADSMGTPSPENGSRGGGEEGQGTIIALLGT